MKCFLLSNYTKKSTNNAGIEYKYLAILYGYLDSWLFCAVKRNLFDKLAAIPAKRRRYESKSDDENES